MLTRPEVKKMQQMVNDWGVVSAIRRSRPWIMQLSEDWMSLFIQLRRVRMALHCKKRNGLPCDGCTRFAQQVVEYTYGQMRPHGTLEAEPPVQPGSIVCAE